MNDLSVLLAKMMPTEFIIEKLKEAIEEIDSSITEKEKIESHKSLSMACRLFLIQYLTKDKTLEETMELSKEAKDVVKIHERMNSKS